MCTLLSKLEVPNKIDEIEHMQINIKSQPLDKETHHGIDRTHALVHEFLFRGIRLRQAKINELDFCIGIIVLKHDVFKFYVCKRQRRSKSINT